MIRAFSPGSCRDSAACCGGYRNMLLAAALAALAACSGGNTAQPRQMGPVQVQVRQLQPERVEQIVELTGTLGGGEQVTVAAQVDGRVEAIHADLGDSLTQGAPLVQLDASELRFQVAQAESEYQQSLARLGVEARDLDQFRPELQADVRRTEADLGEAKRNRLRGDELMQRGLLAEGELDTLRTRERVADAAHQKAIEDARSNFALAKGRRASLGLARKKLKDATITSPIQGAVARRMVSLGEYVKAGQAVAVVVMTDPLKLHGEVPDRYMGKLQPGMQVEVELDLAGTVKHRGEIARIGPLVSPTSRTFPVEALFRNEEGKLKPGLFARARIRIGSDEEVFAVPETAVSSVAGVNKVFVVGAEGKATVRPVTILRKRGGDALLQGQLASGERLILTGIARLFEGSEVQVVDAVRDVVAEPEAGPGAGGGGSN